MKFQEWFDEQFGKFKGEKEGHRILSVFYSIKILHKGKYSTLSIDKWGAAACFTKTAYNQYKEYDAAAWVLSKHKVLRYVLQKLNII